MKSCIPLFTFLLTSPFCLLLLAADLTIFEAVCVCVCVVVVGWGGVGGWVKGGPGWLDRAEL